MIIEHTAGPSTHFSVKCLISSSFSRPKPSLSEPYKKIQRAILAVYHRFQPGKLRKYCVLSGRDDCDGRDGSGGEDSGDEDEVGRQGMVWRMVEVCRPEPVVVWWTVEVVRMVVV